MFKPIMPMELYNLYLDYKIEENHLKRYEGNNDRHHPSGAGGCVLKHIHYKQNTTPSEVTQRSKRLLRLGTITGDDIQTGIEFVINNKNKLKLLAKKKGFDLELIPEEGKFYQELFVEDKELKFGGYIDMVYINEDGKSAIIYDNKTKGFSAWSMMFKQRSLKPYEITIRKTKENKRLAGYFEMNEMQIGSYAIGLKNKFSELEHIYLALIYYKKDDSNIKTLYLTSDGEMTEKKESTFIKQFDNLKDFFEPSEKLYDSIKNYWKYVNETCNNKFALSSAGELTGIPFESWECNYCGFDWKCKELNEDFHNSLKKK